MPIVSNLSDDGQEPVVRVDGRFDFSAHQAFRDTHETQTGTRTRYCVDLRDTTYLDSSALGMLLLWRDHAGGDNAVVNIVNCNPDVRKILSIANFEQLFAIG